MGEIVQEVWARYGLWAIVLGDRVWRGGARERLPQDHGGDRLRPACEGSGRAEDGRDQGDRQCRSARGQPEGGAGERGRVRVVGANGRSRPRGVGCCTGTSALGSRVALYLTDSSIWIGARHHAGSYLPGLLAERIRADEVAVCIPIALEVLAGPPNAAALEEAWQVLWQNLRWLPVREAEMERARELLFELARTTAG